MSHEQFLQQAVNLACTNLLTGGGPFGALIVREQRIVAACGNQVTPNLDPTAHAEVMAIRSACQQLGSFQLSDCILYTSCEPCPMCLGAIYWARLAKVYFACNRADASASGFDDGFIYDEIPKPPAERKIVMEYLALDNARQPFQEWDKLSYKLRY